MSKTKSFVKLLPSFRYPRKIIFISVSFPDYRLQNFIDVWQKNRHKKKGDELLEYPTLSKMPIQLPGDTSKLWSECAPIESLSAQEYKDVLKHLRLPLKDFKLEDFVRFEARVSPDHQEIIFPVRYVDSKSTIVGLRRVWMCPETRSLVEDNLPDGRLVSSCSISKW